MPSHYLYVCGNGHEEMRYRNSSRCRKCGLPILRKDAPLPDKELQSLRAQNAALLAEVEALDKLVAADAKVRAAASALLAILQEPVWGRNNWGIRKTDAMAALDAALNG